MPRSPTQPTVASFLKPNPGISPPGKKGKGKKRKLSSSPNSNNVFSSKKLNDAASPKVALSTFDSDFPPLPQTPPLPDASVMATPALSPSPHPPQQPCLPENPLSNKNLYNPKDLNSTTISHSLSSMDDSLLEMDQEDAPILDSFPTSDEADDLLRDDAPGNLPPSESVDSPPSSPTAAVKFAIEAQIAENLVILSSKPICVESNKDAINDSTPSPTLTPFLAPPSLKKPLPLFPEGLPPNCISNGSLSTPASSSGGNSRGYFTDKGKAQLDKPTGNSHILPPPKTTYASKTKSPQKTKTLLPNILYVYSTAVSKAPLSQYDWEGIDTFLIQKLALLNPGEDTRIRIASSGYDAAHKCGFIACRDLLSENWVKSAIRGGTRFRAWSKGEQPEVRLCRLYFPSRFDCLNDDILVPLLQKHNPPLKHGTLTLKNIDLVQGGRALFLEMDAASYGYVKAKSYKLEFSMTDIDCQLYIPPVKRAVIPVKVPSQVIPPSSGSANAAPQMIPSPPITSSSKPPEVASLSTKHSVVNKSSSTSTNERSKRERPGPETSFRDSSKKIDTGKRPPQSQREKP